MFSIVQWSYPLHCDDKNVFALTSIKRSLKRERKQNVHPWPHRSAACLCSTSLIYVRVNFFSVCLALGVSVLYGTFCKEKGKVGFHFHKASHSSEAPTSFLCVLTFSHNRAFAKSSTPSCSYVSQAFHSCTVQFTD